MSKYTTEVRFICESALGMEESAGYDSVNNIISRAIPKVINFDFPMFDEAYRNVLLKKILKHYYTREIGFETVGLWKLKLDTKLNEIMPYYNKLYLSELLEFNPLYTSDLTRTKEIGRTNEKTDDEKIEDNTTNINNGSTSSETESHNTSSGEGTNSNTNWDLYSDTPQGAVTNLENQSYLTNARKVTDSANSSSEAEADSNSSGTVTTHDETNNQYERNRDFKSMGNSTEDYLERVVGYSNKNASELLLKYRETFLNIDMMIINELESLFMQLW